MPTRLEAVAVFIDVANADGVDLRAVLNRARQLGRLDEVRAYGDFRQRHLDEVALEMYALGIRMIHCPSWSNGPHCQDGSPRRKRTDDRLMEKEVRDLIHRRPYVGTYVLVTGDADIIPTVHVLTESQKAVRIICPGGDERLGRVLRMCDVAIEEAPLKPAPSLDPRTELGRQRRLPVGTARHGKNGQRGSGPASGHEEGGESRR